MGAYSTGLLIRGASQGLTDVNADQRRQELQQQHDTLFQEGQADRSHALERQGVTEKRADTEYAQKQKAADRFRE